MNIKPYVDGQDVKVFQQYFLEQYMHAFGHNVLPFMFTEQKLFDSYFRLRRLDEIKNLNAISEYGHPSVADCKRIGRANLPFNPVFYCSHFPKIAVEEMKKWNGLGKKYALAKWTKRAKFTTFKHMPTFSSRPEFRQHAVSIVNKNVSGKQDDRDNMLEFLLFLGDEFLSENDYSVSASFAHQLIYNGQIDVLSYPSVIDLSGINFAFSPRVFAEKKLVLDRVYIIEPKSGNDITILRVGIFGNNTPYWYNVGELDRQGEIIMTMYSDFSGAKKVE
ncbi:MAG: RES domain-containing protein [Bacteroidetes bacterium]|nr:RES domain-containing protein [Bacteroidota bacterium]